MPKKGFVLVAASHLTFVMPCLKDAGYRLTTVEDFGEGRDILAAKTYDLIIYEFLQEQDYISIISEIRNRSTAPVLALVESADYDALEPLLTMADDAMLIPFNQHELTVRARALAKYPHAPWRIRTKEENCLWFGEIRVYPSKHIATQGHKLVKLSPTEYTILTLLGSHPGQLFSRAQIYDRVNDGYSDINVDKTVSNHISRLRKKLSKITNKNHIRAEREIGYRFE